MNRSCEFHAIFNTVTAKKRKRYIKKKQNTMAYCIHFHYRCEMPRQIYATAGASTFLTLFWLFFLFITLSVLASIHVLPRPCVLSPGERCRRMEQCSRKADCTVWPRAIYAQGKRQGGFPEVFL